ncbi:MAG: lysine--tRNA ligase [Candidatus Thalassarchaeaceae archaeon]|jgi:lysyl-tRNA synthetase class 1|nr:lysine--tRNA ligase [Candidatus Thalassarchaeaceae archaeon]
MHWADAVAKSLSYRGDKHVIASGITPSGEFHIGHLREILTSDIIKRACQNIDLEIEFVFFVDDADPLRKVYSFLDQSYEQYIGHQLANIPPPDTNGVPDQERFSQGISYANHFLEPFIKALELIGVEIDEIIYNYASYQSGKFADCSRIACNRADDIREIIERVSGRELDADWFPWNPIDHKGSIDGVRITGWDDPVVSWIDSDGNNGQSDVTKGEGKLPWRVDWPAKWNWRGVTMEPFGKDHGAAGGSYSTGKEIAQILGNIPPHPLTYEWISLKGVGAMSSSTGVSIGPLEALELVPPEIMRYLIARNKPQRHIEFNTGSALIELADEYQRKYAELESGKPKNWEELSRRQQMAWETLVAQVGFSRVDESAIESSRVSFRHLALLAQLRSEDADIWASLLRSQLIGQKEYDELKSDNEQKLSRRLRMMRTWINSQHFPEDFRLRIQSELSDGAKSHLDSRDCDYLRALQTELQTCLWDSKTINNHICDLAKSREIKLRDAFQMIYWIILDQNFGPKLAAIMEELDRVTVIKLLDEAIEYL